MKWHKNMLFNLIFIYKIIRAIVNQSKSGIKCEYHVKKQHGGQIFKAQDILNL